MLNHEYFQLIQVEATNTWLRRFASATLRIVCGTQRFTLQAITRKLSNLCFSKALNAPTFTVRYHSVKLYWADWFKPLWKRVKARINADKLERVRNAMEINHSSNVLQFHKKWKITRIYIFLKWMYEKCVGCSTDYTALINPNSIRGAVTDHTSSHS